MKKLYGIFGGNFDPIHYGHIYSAKKLAKEINIEKIIFLPNNCPPHRDKTQTSLSDKINMIKLAINNHSLFEISYLETKKNKCFYTIDTLKKIREEISYLRPLCFIIGEDNLQKFYLWKDWKKILLYSHLLICPRKHKKKNNNELEKWIKSHIVYDCNLLHQKSFGLIFFSRIPLINISSTRIRKNYFIGKSSHSLLPPVVNNYILFKKLYYNNK
ncbi:nicotinate-mononucleotide adenylyltransferase [Buchnera aphidicola str. Ak (Acyrthosiphon kondoi)]|uniref:Probable nicotinate-nucleotide adenylyltransferase n=1 Tax=Buchnera aphidicola str. Ak (Acyrthosiphon kondoi) TaxID=1005090 RepID=G2LNE6_9GAMM|nr:nicotinate-nucleotide adenylyltransferase [Buchnera aphidicola]AEO08784.1 nicotinate-mononucleotide adenylyltransferase [Buchnera aphidicola str. Ak (Acyrthosiphon kondoi)]WAI18412.1 MAG: nicotinate-nucleotide adenylyltransferase [Buchnera aphidicola (Acyrthosiphon caraganae)]